MASGGRGVGVVLGEKNGCEKGSVTGHVVVLVFKSGRTVRAVI